MSSVPELLVLTCTRSNSIVLTSPQPARASVDRMVRSHYWYRATLHAPHEKELHEVDSFGPCQSACGFPRPPPHLITARRGILRKGCGDAGSGISDNVPD